MHNMLLYNYNKVKTCGLILLKESGSLRQACKTRKKETRQIGKTYPQMQQALVYVELQKGNEKRGTQKIATCRTILKCQEDSQKPTAVRQKHCVLTAMGRCTQRTPIITTPSSLPFLQAVMPRACKPSEGGLYSWVLGEGRT